MRLQPVKRELEAHVARMLAPLLNPRIASPEFQVLSWDVEQGISLFVNFEGRTVLIEIEPKDLSGECFARTERFNICARAIFQASGRLTEREGRFVQAIVGMIRKREHLLPRLDRVEPDRGTAVREILVERVLFQEGVGHYYLNPYVGCMIGCEFCYVAQRAELSWGMQGLARMPWGRRLDVKVNAPEVLRREVLQYSPGVVRMSPILTDPYQPVERKYRITRGCLEAMEGTDFVPFLLTRAVRALEDLPVLRKLRRAAVGFSIPTEDDRYRAMIEPGADSVDARIDALRQFAEAGLFTVVVIQPLMPMDPDALVRRVAPYVRAVRIERMQFPERIRHLFQRHGLEYALNEDWAAETQGRLKAGFRERGVPVDETDNLVGFVLGK